LNFETSNLRLSGLIDSAEGCALMALVWSLMSRRISVLPLVAVAGALAKESFVPFCTAMTFVWWFASRRHEQWRAVETAVILSTGIIALLTTTAVQSIMASTIIWPWTFAASMHADSGFLSALRNNVVDKNLLYGFIWLVPLGVVRLRIFPKPWLLASGACSLLAFVVVAYYGAPPGAAARSVFSVTGPLLSLSAATLANSHPPRSVIGAVEASK
jgi:hypothetical protein